MPLSNCRPAAAIYEVTLTMENECAATTITKTVDITTVSNSNPTRGAPISLSPNPAARILQLRTNNTIAGPSTYAVFNALGQQVIRPLSFTGTNNATINIEIAALPPGKYYVQIVSGTATHTAPFIKE